MATCRVIRNNENRITSVETNEGQPSQLFEKIHSNVFGADADISLSVYSQSEQTAVKEVYKGVTNQKFVYETGEPRLYYKFSNDLVTESVEEGILAGHRGHVEVGFLNPQTNELMKAYSFNMNATETSKVLRDLVHTGLISTDRVLLPSGETRYKGVSETKTTQKMGAELAKDYIQKNLHKKVETFIDGTFAITEYVPQFIDVTLKDGGVKKMTLNEAVNLLQKNPEQIENRVEVIFQTLDLFSGKVQLGEPVSKGQGNSYIVQMKRLNTFLNNIGFTTTTLENYKKAYAERNGSEIGIEALVDFAQKVVVLSEKGLTIEQIAENFTEEVAHAAVETYKDQVGLSTALLEVSETAEYKELAEKYRERYSSQYSGLELEEVVRKEILGKLVAKEVTNNLQSTEKNIFRRIWDFFVNKIRDNVSRSSLKQLDQIVKSISDSILSGKIEAFDPTLSKQGVMYSLSGEPLTEETVKRNLAIHNHSLNSLAKGLREIGFSLTTPVNQSLLKEIERQDQSKVASAIDAIIQTSLENNRRIEEDIVQSRNKNESLDTAVQQAYKQTAAFLEKFGGSYLNFLDEYKEVLKASPNSSSQIKVIDILRERIQEAQAQSSQIAAKLKNMGEKTIEAMVERYIEEDNVSEKDAKELRAQVKEAQKDLTYIQAHFGLPSETSSLEVGLLWRLAKTVQSNTQNRAAARLFAPLKKFQDEGYRKYQDKIIAKDKNGNNTYYIENHVDNHRHEQAWFDFQVNTISALSNGEITKDDVINELKSFGQHPAMFNGAKLLEEKAAYEKYAKEKQKFSQANDDLQMSSEVIQERENKQSEAEISEYTKRDLVGQWNDYMRIINDIGGDKSLASDTQRSMLEKHYATIQSKASGIDASGEFYAGIKRISLADLFGLKKNNPAQFEKLPEFIRNHENLEKIAQNRGNLEIIFIEDTVASRDALIDEARAAVDRQMLSLHTMLTNYTPDSKGFSSGGVSARFLTELKKRIAEEGKEAGVKFAMANGVLAHTDEYFNSLSDESSWHVKAEKALEEIEDDTEREFKEELLKRAKDIRSQMAAIRKPYYSKDNTDELLTSIIPTQLLHKLLELEEDMSNIKNSFGFLKDTSTGEDSKAKIETITKLNPSFHSDLKESGKDFLDFSKQHMTSENKTLTNKFEIFVNDLLVRNRNPKDKFRMRALDRLIADYGETDATLKQAIEDVKGFKKGTKEHTAAKEQAAKRLSELYAESKIATYYKMYELNGKAELMEAINEGKIDILDLVEGKVSTNEYPALRYLELRPDYSWSDIVNDVSRVNQNYNHMFGMHQPKFSEYGNKGFFEKYGITEADYFRAFNTGTLENLETTKNKEQFEYWKMHTDLQMQTQDIYKDGHSVFERVQQSSSAYEKITGKGLVNAPAEIKDMMLDLVKDRADEMDYGSHTTDAYLRFGVEAPPKMFRKRLEDVNMITQGSFSAASANLIEAIRWEERTKALPEASLLLDRVKNAKYKTSRATRKNKTVKEREGAKSHTLTMMESVYDNAFLGIKQAVKLEIPTPFGNVDATRVITKLQALSSFLNISFSPAIESTSWVVSKGYMVFEKHFGNVVSKDAYNRSFSTRNADVSVATKDLGSLSPETRFIQLMTFLNMRDISDFVTESQSTRAGRVLKGAKYAMTRLVDNPVRAQISYSVLMDYRMIEGSNKFVNYHQFVAMQKAKGASKAEIDAAWKNIKTSYFDYLETSDKGIKASEAYHKMMREKYKDQGLTTAEIEEIAKKEFERVRNSADRAANQMMQRANTVIDMNDFPLIKRNALTNTLMQHSGWLVINLQRMFKNKHHNFAMGQYDEGTYRTAGRLMREHIEQMKKASDFFDIGSYKEVWANLSEAERNNVKRAGFEMLGLAAATILLLSMGKLTTDDGNDEEQWLQDYAEYIGYRVYPQIMSNNPIGVVPTVMDKMRNPFVMIRTVDDMSSVMWNTVTGNWENATEGQQNKLKRLIPAYQSIHKARYPMESKQKFIPFNSSTLFPVIMAQEAMED